MGKKILFVDMDNVLVDFKSGLNKISPELLKQYDDDGTDAHLPHYDDIPGLFKLMDPVNGAIETIKELSEVFDIYILSTAPWDNPSAWTDKLEWIKKYFGGAESSPLFKRLILSHHKELCVQPNSYLIDDRPNNGASSFGDRWLWFGENGKFKNWGEIKEYLFSIEH